MSEHTPGPWVYGWWARDDKRNCYVLTRPQNESVLWDDEPGLYAGVAYGDTWDGRGDPPGSKLIDTHTESGCESDPFSGDSVLDISLVDVYLMAAAPDLLEFAARITQWLDGAEKKCLAQERDNRGRFDNLADACKADATNYRAMAIQGHAAIAKAENTTATPS